MVLPDGSCVDRPCVSVGDTGLIGTFGNSFTVTKDQAMLTSYTLVGAFPVMLSASHPRTLALLILVPTLVD